jgi:alpha-galactosidase
VDCHYFKLDATVWAAVPFGHRAEAGITTVEAYRNGMSAIRDAVGEESFVLGCNARSGFHAVGNTTGCGSSTLIA